MVGHPAYHSPIGRPEMVMERLRLFRQSGLHHFWPDAVSMTDLTLFRPSYMRGHRQVTDTYLLALAVRMGGRLATFDRSIQVSAVAGATKGTLAVIGAVAPPTG